MTATTQGPLGMYVHTHWAYHHPYAARTWTLADWHGYLEGLALLGYNTVMIWPQLEGMSPAPNSSDRAFLEKLAAVIRLAHQRWNMKVLITASVNVVGNDQASRYPFEDRPWFVCERKINPADPAAVAQVLAERRRQFEPIREADALVLIDSDPGGYVGSTNAEFVALAAAQVRMLRELNPRLELYYWMWVGWENYNRFWAAAATWQPGQPEPAMRWDIESFLETLTLMRERVPEPWSVLSTAPVHHEATGKLGLDAKRMFNPYGCIEGEPTFPLTNYTPRILSEALHAWSPDKFPGGIMAAAQTHCLQLAQTYLFAHLARGGTPETIDLPGFADRLLPGHGAVIAAGWEAIGDGNPDAQRQAAETIRHQNGNRHKSGPLAGLLFGDADRFLTDLAMNLEVRAALAEFKAAPSTNTLRQTLTHLRPYQQRLGYADAYIGPLAEALNQVAAQFHDPGVDAVLQQFRDWRHPEIRNGIVPRLLDALEHHCNG